MIILVHSTVLYPPFWLDFVLYSHNILHRVLFSYPLSYPPKYVCVCVCVCGGSDLTFASCVSHFHELTKSPVSLCLHLSVHSCVLELLQSLLLL